MILASTHPSHFPDETTAACGSLSPAPAADGLRRLPTAFATGDNPEAGCRRHLRLGSGKGAAAPTAGGQASSDGP